VAFAPVVTDTAADVPADLPLAEAASLVKAADMQRAAAEAEAAARAAEEAAKKAEAAKAAEAARAAEEAAKKAEATSAGSALQMIAGRVTSGFGSRWGRAHEGLDIAARGTRLDHGAGERVRHVGPGAPR
jgi:murein DD-endopeptidase MepM/ murein hydrolase activator NlpD